MTDLGKLNRMLSLSALDLSQLLVNNVVFQALVLTLRSTLSAFFGSASFFSMSILSACARIVVELAVWATFSVQRTTCMDRPCTSNLQRV